MSSVMEDRDRSWLRDFDANYQRERVEAERKRQEKENQDAEHWARTRAIRAREDIEYAQKAKKVWQNLSWRTRKRPITGTQWEKIRRRATKPCMWPEITSEARVRVDAEAEAPVDQGILGLDILSSIRNRLTQVVEQQEKERERIRRLKRPSIF